MGRVAGFVLANGYSELEYVLLDWSMLYMIGVCYCLLRVCFLPLAYGFALLEYGYGELEGVFFETEGVF